MINESDLRSVIGATAYDSDGDKLGTVGQVYLDDETGRPEWATIRTGLFGTKESFVPLAEASLSGDGLRMPYDKNRIKGAPSVDAEAGHLSQQEEAELYSYYGLGYGESRSDSGLGEGTGIAGTGTGTDRDMMGTGLGTGVGTGTGTGTGSIDRDNDGVADHVEGRAVGHDTSGLTTDDAMTRSEERLRVGTERVEAGRARLRKYVVSETVTQTVPVTREEVRVEREPITDANIGNAMDGPAISEEEHEVVLHEERPMVAKEAVPVERVRLTKDAVTDQETVSEEVRKEVIDTEGGVEGDIDLRGAQDDARRF